MCPSGEAGAGGQQGVDGNVVEEADLQADGDDLAEFGGGGIWAGGLLQDTSGSTANAIGMMSQNTAAVAAISVSYFLCLRPNVWKADWTPCFR